MTRFIALFRGINVGGHHKVRMDELKTLHEALGLQDVVTYIQSGNVVFTSAKSDTDQLAGQIEAGFAQKFGYQVKVMVRSSAELAEIIERNPFQNQVLTTPQWVVVLFLTAQPEQANLADFQKTYAGPEEMYLSGQELYLYYPNSIGHSKLSLPQLEKKLQAMGTARNWNTVLKLQELARR